TGIEAHPVLGGDQKEFFGSLQGGPAVPKNCMIDSLPQQSAGKGNRVREPPHGVQKFAAFSERSRRIAEKQQRRGKGAGCERCVLSLAEVAERCAAEELNSEFKVLARCLKLAEVKGNVAKQEMSSRDYCWSLRRFGEGKKPLSQLARHTILAPDETEV